MPMVPTGLNPAPDPAALLEGQLHRSRWQAVIDYQAAMRDRGCTVLFAEADSPIERAIRRTGTPIGGDVGVLSREGDAGEMHWTAVPGDLLSAAVGDWLPHAAPGAQLDVWEVHGRYRLVAVAAHPRSPYQLLHVLLRLDGSSK